MMSPWTHEAGSPAGGNQPRSGIPDAPPQYAFVLGLGENGYGVVRALAGQGVALVGFHREHAEFGRYSRLCEARFLAPSLDDAAICRELVAQARLCGGRPVLVPTSDEYAALLASRASLLAPHFLFHWVDEDCLADIIDKARILRICELAGVPVPRTRVTVANDDPASLARELVYPCLIKPNRSFRTPFPAGLKNFVAATRDQLVGFYRSQPQLLGATICQEVIAGGDGDIFQCTVLVGRSGGAPVLFSTRKLHQYPPGYGVMCFGRSESNPVVEAMTLRMLEQLQYRGLASLEFKYRPADGSFHFIEMNPRLPWYNQLFATAGVNLAHLAYRDLTGDALPVPRAIQENGVYWLSLKLDFGWFLRTRRSAAMPLLSWLLSVARARSHAWFNWFDPQPFARASLDLLGMLMQRLFFRHAGALRARPARSTGR